MFLKKLSRMLLSSKARASLKRWKRKLQGIGKGATSLEDLRKVLVEELGVRPGDRLIVTSGFGYLGAGGYSPEDVVCLLQSLVTDEGLIMMPYYPPKNSHEWASEGEVFDMNHTKSGMGVLTNVFAQAAGVYMSVHPTKAVCVWGKDAEQIVQGHECTETPYAHNSPYGKVLQLGSKSIGLGVGNAPMFHVFEDTWDSPRSRYYQEQPYLLNVILKDGSKTEVSTMVHRADMVDSATPISEYIRNLNAPTYRRIKFGKSFVWIADNTELSEITKRRFEAGQNRFKR